MQQAMFRMDDLKMCRDTQKLFNHHLVKTPKCPASPDMSDVFQLSAPCPKFNAYFYDAYTCLSQLNLVDLNRDCSTPWHNDLPWKNNCTWNFEYHANLTKPFLSPISKNERFANATSLLFLWKITNGVACKYHNFVCHIKPNWENLWGN